MSGTYANFRTFFCFCFKVVRGDPKTNDSKKWTHFKVLAFYMEIYTFTCMIESAVISNHYDKDYAIEYIKRNVEIEKFEIVGK